MPSMLNTSLLSDGFLEKLRSGLIEHLTKTSRAAQSTTIVRTNYTSLDIPVIGDDVVATWTPEGSEIAPSAPDMRTVHLIGRKLAALTQVTNESLASQNVDLLQIATRSMGRSLVDATDRAFYNQLDNPAPQGGLGSITSPTTVEVGAATFPNLDSVYEAAALIADHGGVASDLHVNTSTLVGIQTLKKSDGSNEGLLEGDASRALYAGTASGDLAITVAGLNLRVSRHVPAGVAWVTDRTRIVTGLTGSPQFEASGDAGFTRDVTYLRGTQGVGFAVADEDSAVKLNLTA